MPRKKTADIVAPTAETIDAIKGFGLDWTCRGFKYEIGQTYTHNGDVEACRAGFHAVESPIDVFSYYAPGTSRYAEVKQGDQSAASSTGYRSAASSTGDQSAASSTGYRSAAMSAGMEGRVMGKDGNALFLVYRDPNTWEILHAWAGIAGRGGIKAETWYSLGADGLPVEPTP